MTYAQHTHTPTGTKPESGNKFQFRMLCARWPTQAFGRKKFPLPLYVKSYDDTDTGQAAYFFDDRPIKIPTAAAADFSIRCMPIDRSMLIIFAVRVSASHAIFYTAKYSISINNQNWFVRRLYAANRWPNIQIWYFIARRRRHCRATANNRATD